jgi:hypothetical protein
MKKTLHLHSKGDEVKLLQNYLVNLGYQIIVVGNFGFYTQQTVIKFQQAHGLAADGVVGPVTWQFIDAGEVELLIEGINVSYINGSINWDKVAQTQTKFVICNTT